MPDTHLHWIVWAAEIKTENGYSEVTYIDVVAANKDEALTKARKIVPDRRYYWLNSVVEHHGHQAEAH